MLHDLPVWKYLLYGILEVMYIVFPFSSEMAQTLKHISISCLKETQEQGNEKFYTILKLNNGNLILVIILQ